MQLFRKSDPGRTSHFPCYGKTFIDIVHHLGQYISRSSLYGNCFFPMYYSFFESLIEADSLEGQKRMNSPDARPEKGSLQKRGKRKIMKTMQGSNEKESWFCGGRMRGIFH